MTAPVVVGDAVAEQLYDECLARTWAAFLCTGADAVDVRRSEVCDVVRATVTAAVAQLCAGGDASPLTRLLWAARPAPAVDDLWWRTPLGVLLTELAHDQARVATRGARVAA